MQKYLSTTEDIDAEESLKIISPVLKRIRSGGMVSHRCHALRERGTGIQMGHKGIRPASGLPRI